MASSNAAPADDDTIPVDLNIDSARTLHPDKDEWVPESWALLDSALAAAPLGDTGMVIAMGRTGGPEYLASEVEHLGHIGTILGAFLK